MTKYSRKSGRVGRQRGLSVVELLVGVTVGLILTTAIIGLFITNKRVYTETASLTRLQENSRFALDYLAQDLRHAYFLGAARWFDIQYHANIDNADVDNNCSGNATVYNKDVPLWGTSATSSTVIDCITDALVVSGIPSDVLVLKSARPEPLRDVNNDDVIGGGGEDSNGDGTIDSRDELQVGTVYIASNTQQGEMFLFADGIDAPTMSLTGAYPYGAAWEYRFYAYYIRDDDPTDDDPPTLARMHLEWDSGEGMQVRSENLAEGVEAMRLLYGVDSDEDGVADRYSGADTVTDWNSVVSIRVYLLVRATEPDRNYQDTKTYQLGDVTVTATQATNDSQGAELRNFRRMVVNTTVNLHNAQFAADGE